MKLINKKGKIINATEKAYRVIYKSKGFKKLEKSDTTKQPTLKDYDNTNSNALEDREIAKIKEKLALKTNNELKGILDEYNIKYTARMTKQDLIDLVLRNVK